MINVNQRAVRNARSLFQLKLTPPIRIRFVRTKKKIKNTCFREQDRVVLYVPIMNTPLGFSLDDNGRIVGFNEDWQRRRVRHYINVDDVVLSVNQKPFTSRENMRKIMKNVKPPFRVGILSNRVWRFQVKNGFVDSSRKIHFVFPKTYPTSLGLRLDDMTLRVICYNDSEENNGISPQRGDRLCALGGETVRNHRDIRRVLEKYRQGHDQDVPIVGTFIVGVRVYTLRLVSGQSLGITMSNEGLRVRKILTKEASRAVREQVRVGDFCMALNGFALNTSIKLREALRRVNSNFETHFEITFGRHREVRGGDDDGDDGVVDSREEEVEVKHLRQQTQTSLREEHKRILEAREERRSEIIKKKSSLPPVLPPSSSSPSSSSSMISVSRNILSSLLSLKDDENDLFCDREYENTVSKKKKQQSSSVTAVSREDALKDLRDRIETARDVQSEINKFCAIVHFLVQRSIKILSVDWTHNADRSVLFNINVRIAQNHFVPITLELFTRTRTGTNCIKTMDRKTSVQSIQTTLDNIEVLIKKTTER